MEKLDIAIIASKKDLAGQNIAKQLMLLHEYPLDISGKKVDVFLMNKPITELENIDLEIAADVFVFASKHVSKAGVNSLTVHSIGNWDKALAGGRGRTLVPAAASLMKTYFKLLYQNAEKLDYEVIVEATHHGPYLNKPTMFIEIGSSEAQWKDEEAGKVVAATIIDAIGSTNSKIKVVVGIGGMHHSPNFRKIMLSESVGVAFVCPKHALEFLDLEMLTQAMEKSSAESVMLDWKGLGSEKQKVLQMLEKGNFKYERTKDLHK